MQASAVQVESLLLEIVIQLIVIVGFARAASALFRRFGQPQVCGEISAGLILGPSALGVLLPHAQRMLFDRKASLHISILSELGLVFMMFLIGLEFDFGHLAGRSRTALSISSAGIILPFALGMILGRWIHWEMDLQVGVLPFSLFIATALSITAMPVLGRIMIEFNMCRTTLGALTMTAAAMDDAVGWLLLALSSAIAGSQSYPSHVLLTVVELLGYIVVMIFVVRPWLLKWIPWVRRDGELSVNGLAQLIMFVLASAAITNAIGLFSVFGAFVLGAILFDQTEFRAAVNHRMRDFVTAFFLPIFFTHTGLRTDLELMSSANLWLICAIMVVTATVGKFGGCSLAARFNGLTPREASCVGIMMNTRGLMELIVLNTGYDLGVIPKPIFSIMVLMALVTTYATTPVLRRLIPGTQIQPCFELSPFMQRSTVGVKVIGSRRTA
jgi:Kef-type K+ transport system membrane component KefB